MKRSSPANRERTSLSGAPALVASAARYNPAAHPSVSWSSSSSLAAPAWTPAPLSSADASGESIAKSAGYDSRRERPSARMTRRRQRRVDARRRAPIAIPAGGERRTRRSRHGTRCLSPLRRGQARPRRARRSSAIADTNRETDVISAPEETSAAKTAWSTGWIPFNATARALSSTTGSLSASSQDTHATRLETRVAHCPSSVVFP